MRHTLRSTAALRGTAALAALGLGTLLPTAARAQTQDLFVSGYDPNTKALYISRFAGTGPGTFGTTPTQVLTDSSLSQMRGLTFDARGDLFSTNMNGNGGLGSITEFPAGATPGTFGPATTFTDPSLYGPVGIVSDAGGDLFVASQGLTMKSGRVTEFLAGATPGTFSGSTLLNSPGRQLYGLTMDARGDLFAASASSNSVVEFAAGATPGTFGAATNFTDPSLNAPTSLTVDARGDLFVANQGGIGSITEFAAGATPGTFGVVTTFASGLGQPLDLKTDARGDLFAATSPNGSPTGSISEFAFNPALGTFGPAQTVETGLSGASYLAFGPSVSAPVPEASTTVSLGLLLLLGAGGVAAARWRRKPDPSA